MFKDRIFIPPPPPRAAVRSCAPDSLGLLNSLGHIYKSRRVCSGVLNSSLDKHSASLILTMWSHGRIHCSLSLFNPDGVSGEDWLKHFTWQAAVLGLRSDSSSWFLICQRKVLCKSCLQCMQCGRGQLISKAQDRS